MEREPRNAIVRFSDGTEMELEGVTASKPAMIRHYNKFVRLFMRHLGPVYVTDVEFKQ